MFQADSVEIVVLVENWVDMLLPDLDPQANESLHCVFRTGLIHHFDPKLTPPQAEFGISLLVRAHRGRHRYTALFDVGLTGKVLAHNLGALREDARAVDHIVISHGHPDHYGGLYGFLALVEAGIPVATHSDAFLPRYAVMPDGRTSPFYNQAFNPEQIERAGGRVVLSKQPLELGCGLRTTGEIPRKTDFEGPRPASAPGAPGLYQLSHTGEFRLDEVWDEQGLVIDVKGEGIVVLTGCAHAGVVNTILQAKEIAGEKPVRAVFGGFHLGFPTTPKENVQKTVDAFQKLDVRMVMPMHCSGLRAHAAFATTMPNAYVQPAVGTVLRFGS